MRKKSSIQRAKRLISPALIAVCLLGVASMAAIVYSEQAWHNLTRQSIPAMQRVKDAKTFLTEGHLWLEELLAGDNSINPKQVLDTFEKAEHALIASVDGTGSLWTLESMPVADPRIRGRLLEMLRLVRNLNFQAQQRWIKRDIAGPGTMLDQRYDANFNKLIEDLKDLERDLFIQHQQQSKINQRIHLGVITVLALLFILIIAWLVQSNRRQAKAVAQLGDIEAKFETAFRQSPVWVVLSTLEEGRYLDVNDTFLQTTGYSREEVIERSSVELDTWQDPRQRDEIIAEIKASGKVSGREVTRLTKSGEPVTMLLSSEAINLGSTQALVSVSLDISERKAAEKEKELLESQLRQAHKMEALGTLAGGIAHDFNNILAAIMGYSELALELSQSGGGNSKEIKQVLAASIRARNLVRQILTFSREMDPVLQPLNINRVVIDALEILVRTIPRMISIETHLSEHIYPVNGDATQLEQVLMNLVSNAKDAMPEGGKLIIETENVDIEQVNLQNPDDIPEGEYVMISVSDTGQGMSKDVLSKIFDPFFTTKEIGKGTGLGLSTAFGVIKSHKGQIRCYSELGHGATFKMYLPALTCLPQLDPAGLELRGKLLRGTETILLVDDESSIRDLGGTLLKKHGYQVMTASSGEEALEIFGQSQGSIDLVVLDVSMPGMGGALCMRRLLEIDPDLKIIIASGYSKHGQLNEMLKKGAAAYAAKPFSGAEFLKTIRQVLDGTPPEEHPTT